MKKKLITAAIILVVLAGLGLTAHLINLFDLVKRIHGG